MGTTKEKKQVENEAITTWINSFIIPPVPVVELEENKAIVEAIKKRFDNALKFAIKTNNEPY